MKDVYNGYWPNFFINKSIICQDTRKKRFLLYYLEKVLTKSLFLFFVAIVVSKLKADISLIENQFYYVQQVLLFTLILIKFKAFEKLITSSTLSYYYTLLYYWAFSKLVKKKRRFFSKVITMILIISWSINKSNIIKLRNKQYFYKMNKICSC